MAVEKKCNCLKTLSIKPDESFEPDIKSTIELDVFINDVKHNIKATGSYSDLEVAMMWGYVNGQTLVSHFGLILKQEGSWVLDGNSRKCLLFHHMGNDVGVQLGFGCEKCVRSKVRNAYGIKVLEPNIMFFDYGRSRAAVSRFMGKTSLKRNIEYKYNASYASKKKELFYDWETTNCLRLVFDLLFYLLLDQKLAEEYTVYTVGNKKWEELFKILWKDYPQFEESMEEMWKKIDANCELKKIAKLLDQQYHIKDALELKELSMKLKETRDLNEFYILGFRLSLLTISEDN